MKYNTYIDIVLYLDDINEIINSLLWYLYYPNKVNDVNELYYAVKSIPERITEIKKILEMELIKNESYFESQKQD